MRCGVERMTVANVDNGGVSDLKVLLERVSLMRVSEDVRSGTWSSKRREGNSFAIGGLCRFESGAASQVTDLDVGTLALGPWRQGREETNVFL